MVKVYFFGHKILSCPRNEFAMLRSSSPKYLAVIRICDIDVIKTVEWYACIIQCFFRVQASVRCLNEKKMVVLSRQENRRYLVVASVLPRHAFCGEAFGRT